MGGMSCSYKSQINAAATRTADLNKRTSLALQVVHTILETIVRLLSIVFNVYLLYLVKYRSNFGSNFYRVMLATDALLDLALAIVVLLAQPASALTNARATNGHVKFRVASLTVKKTRAVAKKNGKARVRTIFTWRTVKNVPGSLEPKPNSC